MLRIIPDIVKEHKVFDVHGDLSTFEAARKMADYDVAALVVVDNNGGLRGIVTERDMTRRVLAKSRDSKKTTIFEIMTKDPDTLGPGDSVIDALELMQTHKYRHIPVVDGEKIVSIVSIRDLYAAIKVELECDLHKTEAFVFGTDYGA